MLTTTPPKPLRCILYHIKVLYVDGNNICCVHNTCDKPFFKLNSPGMNFQVPGIPVVNEKNISFWISQPLKKEPIGSAKELSLYSE
jgi:hypothetical protein